MIFKHCLTIIALSLSLSNYADSAEQTHMGANQAPLSEACGNQLKAPASICSKTVSASFDDAGKLWTAWAQNGHVYVQSSTDNGHSFSTPVKVNTKAESIRAEGEGRPKIKTGPNGLIYVSWGQNLSKPHTGHIRFSRSINSGKTFEKPVTINSDQNEISHRFDELLAGPDGSVALFWLDARDMVAAKQKGQEYNGSALYYAWSEDGGATFQPNAKAADLTCQCCRIKGAIDIDGLPTVMWRHVFDDNIRDHALVNFKTWNDPGPVLRVSRENWKIDACPHHGPGFSIGGHNGRYHGVWFNNADSAHGLFYAYSDDQGNRFSPPVNFGNYELGASHPDVMALNGQVFIAWNEFDGTQNRLMSMVSNDDGQTWETPRIVARTKEQSDHPFLISDGRQVYISWHIPNVAYQLYPAREESIKP
ncbi:sialidase family protein [Methylicorpusculum sp.]|uniref:sialidase family protein n=1 Tax=Methylicorpusculum sp. TaxID=2713644 RepID=UPI00272EEAFC|nr:sialidase family protein [Methylicorpusculum sp.]MDP2177288.1 sialidase family protein [Methylicorpusculum sp.]MDP3531213.1 sialidase family protein [Methylicorpusculum sp.]MDZ4151081.1 sialidase family protein [Methylicorpusculum sp.]